MDFSPSKPTSYGLSVHSRCLQNKIKASQDSITLQVYKSGYVYKELVVSLKDNSHVIYLKSNAVFDLGAMNVTDDVILNRINTDSIQPSGKIALEAELLNKLFIGLE